MTTVVSAMLDTEVETAVKKSIFVKVTLVKMEEAVRVGRPSPSVAALNLTVESCVRLK